MHEAHTRGMGCVLWLEVAELADWLYTNNKSKNVHSRQTYCLCFAGSFRLC
jgi:hypothetical protein